MRSISYISALSFLLFTATCFSAPATLDEYKKIYEKEIARIDEDFLVERLKATQKYEQSITTMKDHYQAAGDLQNTYAFIQEQKRFSTEKSIPVETPVSSPKALADIRNAYHVALQKAEGRRQKAVLSLSRKYARGLRGFMKSLMQKNKMQEAIAVDAEAKKIEAMLAANVPAAKKPGSAVRPPSPRSGRLPTALKNGLILHYSFDTKEKKVTDRSGKGNDGELDGPEWVANARGSGNGAYEFDGMKDQIIIGAPDVAGSWTAATWVKRDTAPNSAASLINSKKFALRLEQSSNTKKLGFTEYGVKDHMLGYETPIGKWIHLVFTGSEAGTKLYVNGKLENTSSETISCPMSTVGGDYKPVKGLVDEVMIFNRTLSDSEIKTLYRSQGGK